MSRSDKMFNDAINNPQRKLTLDELTEKYRPKKIKKYKEDGVIVTVYEAR